MISIIIPAYNAGQMLGSTVESILGQTEEDWELILVDDGSTDNTGALCDRYSAADRRIRVLHTPNGGVSTARNRGIDASRGEYLTFLDADDIFHPRFLEILHRLISENNADIAIADTLEFTGNLPHFKDLPSKPDYEVVTGREALVKTLYQRNGYLPSICAKLYTRNFWKGLRFTPGTRYEDLDFIYRLLPRAGQIVNFPHLMYGYRQHGNSFLHRFTPGRLDVLDVTEQMEAWIAENHPEFLAAARDRRMSANFNIFLLAEKANRQGELSTEEREKIEERCWQQIRRLRRQSLFNSKVRLKNRIGAAVSYLGAGFLRRLYRFI